MDDSWTLARRLDALWIRARMIQAIRRFLMQQGYLEVETPQLIPAPAPEDHIDAMACGNRFLHTSPELCMKRLLAAGYARIFQICKCFRAAERGSRHLPEFTMLEWYRQGIDYQDLMDECETMIRAVVQELGYGDSIMYQGRGISLRTSWERLSISDAFARHAPVSLADALSSNTFDEVLSCHIEPHLGVTTPTFLYDYPAELSALSRLKKDDPSVAERFELYVGGLELANGFSELTDPGEQRLRFENAQRERLASGKTVYPVAEAFLQCLARMPASAGIALGIDRLAMVFTDSPEIDAVVAFTPEDL